MAKAGVGDVAAASTGTAEAWTARPPRAAFDALPGDLLPRQGSWSDEDYPWLTDHGRWLIEFTDGRIEELPLPICPPLFQSAPAIRDRDQSLQKFNLTDSG